MLIWSYNYNGLGDSGPAYYSIILYNLNVQGRTDLNAESAFLHICRILILLVLNLRGIQTPSWRAGSTA